MKVADFSLEEITIGQKASFTRTLTHGDVRSFAELSGDQNPLHGDAAYAATTPFRKPIVHGMLLGALCSTLIGMHLPGKRSLYLSQSLEFKKPVYPGDTLVVEGVVTAKSMSMHIIELKITFHKDTELAAEGVAKIKVL